MPISNGKSAMLVGCAYKAEMKYRKHKRASSELEQDNKLSLDT